MNMCLLDLSLAKPLNLEIAKKKSIFFPFIAASKTVTLEEPFMRLPPARAALECSHVPLALQFHSATKSARGFAALKCLIFSRPKIFGATGSELFFFPSPE